MPIGAESRINQRGFRVQGLGYTKSSDSQAVDDSASF